MDYEFCILAVILFFCSWVKLLYGLYFLIFWIIVAAFGFFFSCNGIYITTQDFPEADIFYETFQGDYQTLYSKLSVFHSIRSKFSLPGCYKPFGIFYDNPNGKSKRKHRAIIGILCDKAEKNTNHKSFNYEEYNKYMKSSSYIKSSIPITKSIYGDYETFPSIRNSFVFLAKIYIKLVNQKFFIRLFNPKWKESLIKTAKTHYKKHYGILELFDHHVIKFYIPVENESNFIFNCEE